MPLLAQAKKKKEESLKLHTQAQALLDSVLKEDRVMTDEEEAKFDELHNEADKLQNLAEKLHKQSKSSLDIPLYDGDGNKLISDLNDAADGLEDGKISKSQAHELCMDAWIRSGYSKQSASEKHQKALAQLAFDRGQKEIDVAYNTGGYFSGDPLQNRSKSALEKLASRRLESALGTTTGDEGGKLIPQGFIRNLEKALLYVSNMMQVCTVMRTATGNQLPWPTVNDTNNEGELQTEGMPVNEQDIALAQVLFYAFKVSSKMIRISNELMEDSAFDMSSVLPMLLGERIGRTINRYSTTGAGGSSEPEGVVTAASAGVTTAAVAAITPEELISLEGSLEPAYRMNASFMFNNATRTLIRKLKDGDNNFIWQRSFQLGDPEMLLGFPINLNQHMASAAASAVPVLYGDFSKHVIRLVSRLKMHNLKERYLNSDQQAFLGFMRFDSRLVDAGTNPIKKLTMAAS